MPRKTTVLLDGVAVLVLLAGCAVALSEDESYVARPNSRLFQHVFGGVGFGPALDLSRSERDFDPRVGHVSTERFEPIPAGDVFGPHGAPRGRFP